LGVDVLPRRDILKGIGMIEPDVTMSLEETAVFLASLNKLKDGLDDFKRFYAAITCG
jgi:hypothetical protein